MGLSIALGDLRIVADHLDSESDAERLYFGRVFASHLREALKLVTLAYNTRQDIREFVETLPKAGQEARAEAARMAHDCPFKHRPDVILWKDLKRVRDDTFHYASDPASQESLRKTLAHVADEEGVYFIREDWQRADYADLVAGNRMMEFADDAWLESTKEMLAAFKALNSHVVLFIQHVEAVYLNRMPPGVVTREDGLPDEYPKGR